MAFLQLIRMVVITLVVLAALGWLPWILIGPMRRRVDGWLAAPFLGLAVAEVFSWYWLEYGTGGLRLGYFVLGAAWLVAAATVILRARRRRERFLPPTSWRGMRAALVLVGAAVVLSSLIMMRSLQGSEPVPSTYGNADIVHYALSAEIYVDEGFDGVGWISTDELGGYGRNDNAGVRTYLTSVALFNATDVWIAETPALAVLVVLTAIAAAWLVRATTRAGPMTASLLGLAALLPLPFTYIFGQYFLAQAATMAGALAFAAVLLELRPSNWRQTLEAAVPATFILVPIVLSYPHLSVGTLAVVGSIVVIVSLDRLRRGALLETAMGAVRAGSVVVLSALGSAVVLAPAISGLVDRVNAVKDGPYGWPFPLLSPLQVLGLEKFGPMTAGGRSVPVEAAGPTSLADLRWWIGAVLVVTVTGLASFVTWRRRGRSPLFPVVTASVVLVSYCLFFDRQGVSYQQWKWITSFQPLFTVAVLVALWAIFDTLFAWFPRHRSAVSASLAVTVALLLGLVLRPVLSEWTHPWWYVTDDLADVRRVADSGLDHVNVVLDPYAETMWAGYFLAPVRTNLDSVSYFPTAGVANGWTVTKRKYVRSTPVREVPLNSTYLLVCYEEPCTPVPALAPVG